MTSNLFIEVFPETIHTGESVSLRISGIVEPNSIIDLIVRIVPPKEPVQEYEVQFTSDSLGFASHTLEYPNNASGRSSTEQPGNYTIFIQNVQTGILLESASFEVEESEDYLDLFSGLISGLQSEVFFTVLAGGIGGLLTYWYSILSAKRATKTALTQKKAEGFLALRPHYSHISRSTRGVARIADRQRKLQLAKQKKVIISDREREKKLAEEKPSSEGSQMNAKMERRQEEERLQKEIRKLEQEIKELEKELERLGGKVDYNEEEIERDYEFCFYNLIVYVKERNLLIDEFGAYALNDPRGETLVIKVEENIIYRLRQVFGNLGLDQIRLILSQGQTFTDLKDKIGLSIRHNIAYELYEKFKKWIKDESNAEEVELFIRDLRLYANILEYEKTKMFNDWYPLKEGINQDLHELRENIIPVLRSDSRYFSIAKDYLNYPL